MVETWILNVYAKHPCGKYLLNIDIQNWLATYRKFALFDIQAVNRNDKNEK